MSINSENNEIILLDSSSDEDCEIIDTSDDDKKRKMSNIDDDVGGKRFKKSTSMQDISDDDSDLVSLDFNYDASAAACSPKTETESVKEEIKEEVKEEVKEETDIKPEPFKDEKKFDIKPVIKTDNEANIREQEVNQDTDEDDDEDEEIIASTSNNADAKKNLKRPRIYLEGDKHSKKKSIKIDKPFAKVLKEHQIDGVKFMWQSCFGSLEKIKQNDPGNGCMLAHCMGLGKTLQVVTIIHTLLANQKKSQVRNILILLPINVLLNWKNELQMWTRDCKYKIKIHELPSRETTKPAHLMKERLQSLKKWFELGGVFLMGYQIYSRLVDFKAHDVVRKPNEFHKYLLMPGPDLIVFDEGHVLKNDETNLAQCVSQINTRRRIVLTGTPLQNNLIEYHCMVNFVRPNLLGSLAHFKEVFVVPINDGQHKDSSEDMVRYMKWRAHALHSELAVCVNRKDVELMKNLIPRKYEYCLSIRNSEKQIELYQTYLDKIRRIDVNNLGKVKGAQLFADFHMLSKIVTHPWVLKSNEIKKKLKLKKNTAKRRRKADNEFADSIDLEAYSDGDDYDDDECGDNYNTPKRNSRNNLSPEERALEEIEKECQLWWNLLVMPECELDTELSGKFVILEKILRYCDKVGDKLVIFSQSLMTLDLIERYLESKFHWSKCRWKRDVDYFRIDGSTSIELRKAAIKEFNDYDNTQGRLFLISTKAGGIGINLVAANRCILFDACWNPSYDTQSVFRIYRIGQDRETFIYRFLSQGTMEEKIYKRQVNKISLAQRVVDEHQLDRHFTSTELKELYTFEPNIYNEKTSQTPILPKDDLLKELLQNSREWLSNYFEHDSLLENKVDEGLSEHDRQLAWAQYSLEKENNISNQNSIDDAIIKARVDKTMWHEELSQFDFSGSKKKPDFSEKLLEKYEELISSNSPSPVASSDPNANTVNRSKATPSIDSINSTINQVLTKMHAEANSASNKKPKLKPKSLIDSMNLIENGENIEQTEKSIHLDKLAEINAMKKRYDLNLAELEDE